VSRVSHQAMSTNVQIRGLSTLKSHGDSSGSRNRYFIRSETA
jgi:hypothetical protein